LNGPPAPFVPVEHQFKTGPELLLTGFGDPVEQDDARIRQTYGAKFACLQMIKNKYDPNNVFHRNANIRPAVAAGS
jgi:hypothetical protein